MDLFTLYCASFLVMVQFPIINGFSRDCNANNTIFAPEGMTLEFTAENILDSHFIDFVQRSPKSMSLLRIHSHRMKDSNIYYFSEEVQNRTTIMLNGTYLIQNVTILMHNASQSDNGTYMLYGGQWYCWILFTMDIQKTPLGSVPENSAVRIYANPVGSLMVRPVVNATIAWYLNGLNVNETADVLVQDGVLWIPHVDRRLTGLNVTYRAVQDNGKTNEVSLTLDVSFGPDLPLALSPPSTSYLLKSGDFMPDISCDVDCSPSCTITWGPDSPDHVLRLGRVTTRTSREYFCYASNFGKIVSGSIYVNVVEEWSVRLSPPTTKYFLKAGISIPDITCSAICYPLCSVAWNRHSDSNILQLGPVTADMNGDYVCSATRNDTDERLEKIITLFVTDDTTHTIALAVIGSVQALTTLAIGAVGLRLCLKTKGYSCPHSLHRGNRNTDKTMNIQRSSEIQCQGLQGTELDNYDVLDTTTRNVSEIELYSEAKPEKTFNTTEEMYENTTIA